MNKTCDNCGKVFPNKVEICDKCGAMKFSFITEKEEIKPEVKKEKIVEKPEIKTEEKPDIKEDIKEDVEKTEEKKSIFKKRNK